jgi:hypothetical protein
MTTTATAGTHAVTIGGAQSPARGTLLGLSVTGGVLVALGVSLGPIMLLDPRPYSELAGTGAHLVHYAVWTACLVALSQLFPRLAGKGRDGGRPVSPVAATVAGTGVALDACARFSLAFVNPMLARHEPALLDTPPDAVLLVPSVAVGVLAMVGVAWLGVSGWRAGLFPRPAVVLLVIGAVAIPALGPVSNVLVGAALTWIGIAALRRR